MIPASKAFILIVFFLLVLDLFVAANAAQHGLVTGNVNFRKGPSTSDPIIGHLRAGEEVQVITRNPAGWYFVMHQGRPGFVHKAYVKLQPRENSRTPLDSKTRKLLFLAAMILVGAGIIIFVVLFAPLLRKIATILAGSVIAAGLGDLGFHFNLLYSLISVAVVLLLLLLFLARREKNRVTPADLVADRLRKAA